MNNTAYKKFLVFISIVILISGAYLYFYKGDKSEAADSSSGTLSSSLDNSSNSLNTSGDSQIAVDTAFLSSLSLLTKIQINTSIFTSKAFNSLKDNNITLEPVVPGRLNPFAPVAITPTININPSPANSTTAKTN